MSAKKVLISIVLVVGLTNSVILPITDSEKEAIDKIIERDYILEDKIIDSIIAMNHPILDMHRNREVFLKNNKDSFVRQFPWANALRYTEYYNDKIAAKYDEIKLRVDRAKATEPKADAAITAQEIAQNEASARVSVEAFAREEARFRAMAETEAKEEARFRATAKAALGGDAYTQAARKANEAAESRTRWEAKAIKAAESRERAEATVRKESRLGAIAKEAKARAEARARART